tara:strand:- start:23 stop:331 length:309 start_codon:yes stop_codon:yes gene_type:complete
MKTKIYVFDIDGTICSNTNGEYKNAIPYEDVIQKINQLYDSGNIIKMMTARGSTTGIDWTSTTESQLKEWGVKHHQLIMNKKPHADVFVDDKAINVSSFRLL